MDTEQETQSQQPQPQPQSQSQPQTQESATANQPQIHTTPSKPKRIFLKTFVTTIILYIVFALLIFLRNKIDRQSGDALGAISNLFSTIIILFITPFISYLIVTSYERKKHPEQQLLPSQSQSTGTDNKQAPVDNIKHAGTFIFTLLAYGFIIFVVTAGGSLFWAGSACEAEGGNDCGAGWGLGTLLCFLSPPFLRYVSLQFSL